MAQTISATDVELQKPVNAVFEQTFLRRAQQTCPFFTGTVNGSLVKNGGSATLMWRRIEQVTPTTTALSELTTTASYMQARDSVAASFTNVTAAVAKYGQFYIVNEEVDLYNPNGTASELVATLGEAGGRSLNQLMRDITEDSSTQRYANNVASKALVIAQVSADGLNRIVNELWRGSARTFYPMTTGSGNESTAPILPAYIGICHPDAAHDVAGLTGFRSVEVYANQTKLIPGEFGYYGRAGRGIRFVSSEDCSIDADAGTSGGTDVRSTGGTNADVYTISVYGQDALGSVGLGQKHADGSYMAGENTGGFELINKAKGSGGTSDPYNEIGTIAWKAFFGGAVLNSAWSRALRVAATSLSN
jgi:N4-gp56 family major capsid protein